jgi:hypothetical protein
MGRTFTEEQERKLCDHMLQLSDMSYGQFWLSYGELHASLQNETMWIIILSTKPNYRTKTGHKASWDELEN